MRPTIHLFADVLGSFGGIETYLDALARRLVADAWSVKVAVCLNAPAPFLNEIEALGVPVYRQLRIPGDRWHLRQRLLVRHVARQVRPGDWVYCVRQPMPGVYLRLVRSVHARGGKIAASWMFAPEFLPAPPDASGKSFKRAVAETDAVISVSECTRDQFSCMYDYQGPVAVVRYHNVAIMQNCMPLPPLPPICVGFIGRIDIAQKNLDTILQSCSILTSRRRDVVFNFHGGGQDLAAFQEMVESAGLEDRVHVHGPYNHRRDLKSIIARNHLFIYTSRFEGGPCFSLLELLQAGRFVVTSPVGGIPDIYAGRPEIGALVPATDPKAIAAALESAIHRICVGEIEPARIRHLYDAHFTDDIAHAQWLTALSLDQ